MTIKKRKIAQGIRIKPNTSGANDSGDITIDSADEKLKVHLDSASRSVVTEDQTQTLENKTIDGTASGNNTVTIDATSAGYDNSTSGLAATDVQAAIDELDAAIEGQNEASEISYDNSTSGLAATDVQAAIDEVEGRVDTAETNITNNTTNLTNHLNDTADAHDASAISNVPAGNLAADNVQDALNELQTDIDNRATATALNDHINDLTDAHDASAISVVATGDLTSTDVQSALEELQTDVNSRALDSDLTTHVNATSAHGVTGDIVGTTDTQTLTNKTVSGGTVTGASIESPTRLDMRKDTLANLQTYAATATDGQLVFATDTQQTFQVVSNALSEVGGSGQGGINYITNFDFEQGVDGWTGDTTFTITADTNNPLRGNQSARLSKAGVNSNGQEVKTSFTVEGADLAQKLTISFDYDASNVNYSDGDIIIGIRKDPTGTPVEISVNANELLGGKGTHYAQFQTDATETDYELYFQVNTTSTDSFSVDIDNVNVGPTAIAVGTIVTDWKDYTPTTQGLGTITVQNALYRRVGDTLHINAKLTTGVRTANEVQISLPDGLSISSEYNSINAVGYVNPNLNTEASYSVLATSGDTYFNVGFRVTGTGLLYTPAQGTQFLSNGTEFQLIAEVKIEGWASNSAMSELLGNRDVVVTGSGNGGQSTTALVTDITFTETKDTTASWNGSVFTAPETGEYVIKGCIRTTSGSNPAIIAFINGVNTNIIIGRPSNADTIFLFDYIAILNKGDTFSVRADTSFTLNNIPSHYIHIQKLSNSQTMFETETVAARYTSDSGQVLNNNDTIVYEDLDRDTHNAYNTTTGVYTAPISGWYNITASVRPSTSSAFALEIQVNSIGQARNTSDFSGSMVVVNKYLNKGDEVEFRNVTGGSNTLNTVPAANYFSIARIK